jgi:hypothetical protein
VSGDPPRPTNPDQALHVSTAAPERPASGSMECITGLDRATTRWFPWPPRVTRSMWASLSDRRTRLCRRCQRLEGKLWSSPKYGDQPAWSIANAALGLDPRDSRLKVTMSEVEYTDVVLEALA